MNWRYFHDYQESPVSPASKGLLTDDCSNQKNKIVNLDSNIMNADGNGYLLSRVISRSIYH
jgi:hypothetical protein